ncbi:hypothetical protein ASD79_16115 [Caulobacter sp. Root655]|uniref:hypothetical protein n=1 Tax=Caulobacter sp. Root655 TaxID=1736578 RepID=UPI0006FF20A7|nr:hypothetical protein [Caulobacter sp. Root655]KRA57837.1 hypothetical protein ASD79_16115 [Caulobacter sp. Root655]
MTYPLRGTVLLAALAFGFSSAAQAQDYVRADCRGQVAPTVLRFDSPEHVRWYKRFWTGDCDHLPFCIPGSPNWNDIVGKLVIRGGPAEQAALLPKACRLGQLIGLEWSRDKKVRRIDTGDLRTFKGMLEKSGDALRGVEQVEVSTRAKLAR